MSEPWDPTRNLLSTMREQLHRAAEPAPVAGTPEPTGEAPTGTAVRMDGMVRVTVTAHRVSALEIDPRAMHRTADVLAAAVTEATNAAFADLRDTMSADLPAAPSVDELSRTLRQVSADSAQAMNRATDGVARSMAAIQRISELHRPQW